MRVPASVLDWGFRRPGLTEVDTPLVLCLWPWNSFKHRHTHAQGTPLSPINPQLSTASRFQSGLSQQTEGIIYAGKEKGTSRRERGRVRVSCISILVRTKGLRCGQIVEHNPIKSTFFHNSKNSFTGEFAVWRIHSPKNADGKWSFVSQKTFVELQNTTVLQHSIHKNKWRKTHDHIHFISFEKTLFTPLLKVQYMRISHLLD